MLDTAFWQDKKVFVTGHTGFKGSWLSIWLTSLGAKVTGYALKPPTTPSLFETAKISQTMSSIFGDVRDGDTLMKYLTAAQPDIVIHMAAQALVRESYKMPTETYAINVMGTVNLLEAVRSVKSIKAVINVTTDKCYENKEWVWGYREYEMLGGRDPYSSSKACSELVTAAYRNSFFNPDNYNEHGVAIASVRAGNVIGGGDWSIDRLVPDCIRSLLNHEKILVRNPQAIRPWQHVLEPLSGYLMLAEKLYKKGTAFGEAWNFGPDEAGEKPVLWIVEKMCKQWGVKTAYIIDNTSKVYEANYLKLDCSKTKTQLGWQPKWNLSEALTKICEWYNAYLAHESVYDTCLKQITEYTGQYTE